MTAELSSKLFNIYNSLDKEEDAIYIPVSPSLYYVIVIPDNCRYMAGVLVDCTCGLESLWETIHNNILTPSSIRSYEIIISSPTPIGSLERFNVHPISRDLEHYLSAAIEQLGLGKEE